MSYNAVELFDSRKIGLGLDRRTILLKYIIFGGDDASELDITSFAFDTSGNNGGVFPYQLDGLNRADCKATNVAGPGGIWLAEAEYGSQFVIAGVDNINTFSAFGGIDAPIGVEYQGDTSGKPLHVTQSLGTKWLIAGGNSGDVIKSGTNLTVTGTGFTPDGYTPQASDIGGIVVVAPGNGWTGGSYNINGIGGGSWQTTPLPSANGLQTGQAGGSWTAYGPNVGSKGGSATNFGQAIGVTLDGVQGTDIFVPSREYTVSGVVAPFTTAMQLLFDSLVDTTNEAEFRGRQPGEVLYQGYTESTTDGKQFRLSHKFAVQPNQYNLAITSKIVIPFKGGWDYLWVYYQPGANNGLPIQIPVAAYVEQMYDSGDFTQFGFG